MGKGKDEIMIVCNPTAMKFYGGLVKK